MRYNNDNLAGADRERRLIQILVPAVRTLEQPEMRYAWLHGYCILSCAIGGTAIDVFGEARIGKKLADNLDLINSLDSILDPSAVLAGRDLTKTIGALCRLPIEAPDQAPALSLLTKLKTMIEARPPIDLGQALEDVPDEGNLHLLAHHLAERAEAYCLEMGILELPLERQVQLSESLRYWRNALVLILPDKEVTKID